MGFYFRQWLPLLFLFPFFGYADVRDYDINIYSENDFRRISLWGSDRAYTNGVRASFIYAPNEVPYWSRNILKAIPLFDSSGKGPTFNFAVTVGQQLYTPEDLGRTDVIVDDQPYAGYLYYGFLLHVQKAAVLQSFEIDVGVVGPAAFGEPTQKNFHRLLGMREPRGWGNQLNNEPVVNLFYQHKRKVWDLKVGDDVKIFDVIPYAGGSLGTVYIFAGLGLEMRLGYALSDDFGPTTLAPVGVDPFIESAPNLLPTSIRANRRWFEAYVFGAIEGRLVARNIFLDGNTFAESHHVDKIPAVLEHEVGVVVRLNAIRLMWTQVVSSRDFTTESEGHAYATVAMSYSYRF